MKTFFTFLFTILYSLAYTQIPQPCTDWDPHDPDWELENFAGSGAILLSSVSNVQSYPINAIDGNLSTSAKTRYELNPFIQINLPERIYIPYIKIYSSSVTSNFYVFTSDSPINFNSTFDELLERDDITSNQVFNYTSGNTVYIDHPAQYLRIQSPTEGEILVGEFVIPGDEILTEICDNEVDDNCDSKVDCEDFQCKATIINAYGVDASCPICQDGEIHIQAAYPDDIEYSIDGGVTYSTACFDEYHNICYWTGLNPGTYQVVARRIFSGCTTAYPENIIIGHPPLGEHGPCFNGGFEDGDFNQWTGGLGTYDDLDGTITPPVLSIPNVDFAINSRHSIINTNNGDWQDPNVEEIDGTFGALGQYFAKLGNTVIGNEAEKLTYCFTVDNLNSDFYFVYAIVQQNPQDNHTVLQQPRFMWNIYNINQPNNPFITHIDIADVNNPFYSVVESTINSDEPIVYKGWTCQFYDLSAYIGQEICVEFINTDCSISQHWGYAYIDALCGFHTDYTPFAELDVPEVICANQKINIDIKGSGYNRFQWTISKLDEFKNLYETVEFPEKIGNDASLEDVGHLYSFHSNFELECGDKVRAVLDLYNDCDEYQTSIDFDFICSELVADYCNVVWACDFENNTRMQGINECDDCEIVWTPSQYLILDDPKFPLVNGAQFEDAYDQIYHVLITHPDGCIHEEDITLIDPLNFNITYDLDITYCDFTIDVVLNLDFPVLSEKMDLIVIDANTNEEYIMIIDAGNSTDYIKRYSITLPRDHEYDITLLARLNTTSGCTLALPVCEETEIVGIIPSASMGPWRMYLPNTFIPGHPDPGLSQWKPSFGSRDLECNSTTGTISNIYKMSMEVWDRYGGNLLKYEKTVEKDLNDLTGVDENDFRWDGKDSQGQYLNLGVYVIVIKVWSCYGTNGLLECFENCPCVEDNECPSSMCSDEPYVSYAFDVTLI